jgi:hypothetical protein
VKTQPNKTKKIEEKTRVSIERLKWVAPGRQVPAVYHGHVSDDEEDGETVHLPSGVRVSKDDYFYMLRGGDIPPEEAPDTRGTDRWVRMNLLDKKTADTAAKVVRRRRPRKGSGRKGGFDATKGYPGEGHAARSSAPPSAKKKPVIYYKCGEPGCGVAHFHPKGDPLQGAARRKAEEKKRGEDKKKKEWKPVQTKDQEFSKCAKTGCKEHFHDAKQLSTVALMIAKKIKPDEIKKLHASVAHKHTPKTLKTATAGPAKIVKNKSTVENKVPMQNNDAHKQAATTAKITHKTTLPKTALSTSVHKQTVTVAKVLHKTRTRKLETLQLAFEDYNDLLVSSDEGSESSQDSDLKGAVPDGSDYEEEPQGDSDTDSDEESDEDSDEDSDEESDEDSDEDSSEDSAQASDEDTDSDEELPGLPPLTDSDSSDDDGDGELPGPPPSPDSEKDKDAPFAYAVPVTLDLPDKRDGQLDTVTMHCHGPVHFTDFVPVWFRTQNCTTKEGEEQELLETQSYGGKITWRGLGWIILNTLPVVLCWFSDLSLAIASACYRGIKHYMPETRSLYQIWRDEQINKMWKLLYQGVDWLLSWPPFSTYTNFREGWVAMWGHWFTPPPPFPWETCIQAFNLFVLIVGAALLLVAVRNHVTYLMSGRFNATTSIRIHRGLLAHLFKDKSLRPRIGMAADKTPASLLSAARYAVNTFNTDDLEELVIENTIEYYLQRRLILAVRSERFRPNTSGLPTFRR